jgi:hypothetical protein
VLEHHWHGPALTLTVRSAFVDTYNAILRPVWNRLVVPPVGFMLYYVFVVLERVLTLIVKVIDPVLQTLINGNSSVK